jgi:glutamate/tyrosine decarboxylase-like PLP-dependent enzyme
MEGSRSAAGACATWLTGQTMTFTPDRFGAMLASTVTARRRFGEAVQEAVPHVRLLEPADTNILCFSIAREGEALEVSNSRIAEIFNLFESDPSFFVSKTTLGQHQEDNSYDSLIDAHVTRYR